MRDLGGMYPGDHEGALNKTQPQKINYIKCGAWIYFHTNGSKNQTGTYNIESIYYHMWWHEPNILHGTNYTATYNVTGGISSEDLQDSIIIDTDNFESHVGNYKLIKAIHYPNPELAVVHGADNFTVMFAGAGPNVTSTPNQHSFVYINLPDNESLLISDTDDDQLNDYEELFIRVTNPYDEDTDNDGILDGIEVLLENDPNDYTDGIDADLSFVTLTDENMPGLTTCPAGDGPAYENVKVTVKDIFGMPMAGIPSGNFIFSIAAVNDTYYYGTLSCTFAPIESTTDANGEINFECIGNTAITGDIQTGEPGQIEIQVEVLGILLNDLDILPCRSMDYEPDGDVDLSDFTLFATDFRSQNVRSDFDFDGDCDLVDFVMFSTHFGHSDN